MFVWVRVPLGVQGKHVKFGLELVDIYSMKDINDYIKLSQEERQEHLNLNEDCREIGGRSTHFKGMLSEYLQVTIPSGNAIHLCHACHNSNCSNPRHLYYGTARENVQDAIEDGTHKSIWERTIEKHGLEEAKRLSGTGNRSAGGKANKGKKKAVKHKANISKSLTKRYEIEGRIFNGYEEIMEEFNISKTQIFRNLRNKEDWKKL